MRLGSFKKNILFVFVDAKTMKMINKRFLGHKGLTDVISFKYPAEEIAGEVFVSPDAAFLYAKKAGISYEEEICRYALHGLLHWMGYDDKKKSDKERMRRMEDKVLLASN